MIEYHTVCIRPVMPPKPQNDTYRDKLIARFGRVPTYQELAKLERATHRMSLDVYQPQMALDKSLEARRERTKETIGQLVAALTRPMTNQGLATATGIPLSTVAHLMLRALDEGAVKRERIQRVYIWERANAPVTVVTPKPAGPYAIPVPVRGVIFESMSACAKHFGISVQAVHDAVKRGRQDFIGLRKQK